MTLRAVLGRGRPIVLAIGFLAACGGPSPTPPIDTTSAPIESTAPGSVCDFVVDMDALVGRTAVAVPSSYSVGSSERCLWVYVTDPSRYVALTAGDSSSHADTIQSFGEGEVVDGVGDEARWWDANQTLSVVIGERSLQIDIRLDDAADPKELAVSVAQAAIAQQR